MLPTKHTSISQSDPSYSEETLSNAGKTPTQILLSSPGGFRVKQTAQIELPSCTKNVRSAEVGCVPAGHEAN